MADKQPGPICIERNYTPIEEEAVCRYPTPRPGPVGLSQPSAVEHAVRTLESEALNFAMRFIRDSNVRLNYLAEIRKFSQQILSEVRQGGLSYGEGAKQANEMRNSIMEASRIKSSDIGRAQAISLKSKGLLLEELTEKYAQQFFKKSSSALSEAERNQVFLEIIKAAGRDRSRETARALRFGKLGKGLWVLTIGIAVYNVTTAEDKTEAVTREGVGIGGGMLGGAAGGAAAGLACGPGAPVCVTVGVFVGGALGALGADLSFDWLKSKTKAD